MAQTDNLYANSGLPCLVMHGCILSFLLGLLSNEFYFKTSAFFMRYISKYIQLMANKYVC